MAVLLDQSRLAQRTLSNELAAQREGGSMTHTQYGLVHMQNPLAELKAIVERYVCHMIVALGLFHTACLNYIRYFS